MLGILDEHLHPQRTEHSHTSHPLTESTIAFHVLCYALLFSGLQMNMPIKSTYLFHTTFLKIFWSRSFADWFNLNDMDNLFW